MKSTPAIQCTGLGKRYYLRDNDANPVKRLTRQFRNRDESLRQHWALRGVDLTINKGESVALLGVNGSGKSTLLKLITGITPVTDGELTVNGRVGGIIDLGAGFHPDLTGYENIFLQGTLLGMPRPEIWARLKDIEDFCELGSFLNSPVRHYSMGMFLRLAFAIAVHTEPDIFIIDEALAVGDGYFMWKCMKKLEEMKAQGKTLLYVSHVPEMVESLCDRAIWMHGGQVRSDGSITEIVQEYQQFQFAGLLDGDPKRSRPELSALIPYSRFGTGEIIMQNVTVCDSTGKPRRFFRPGEALEVHFDAVAKVDCDPVSAYIFLERPGKSVTVADSSQRGTVYSLKEGTTRIKFQIPALPLRPGPYFMTVAIGATGNYVTVFDAHQKIYSFTITDPDATAAQYSNGFLIQPTAIRQSPIELAET